MNKANKFPILKKSPIVEATFQVNFAIKPLMTETNAKSFVAKNFPGYSYKEDIFSESIAVKKRNAKDPPENITHQQSWTGVRFTLNNRVITVFANGFAFGILKPYPTDGSFFAEIKNVTKAFAGLYASAPVTRVGLRFINRFAADDVEHRPDRLFSTLPAGPSRLGCGEPIQFLYQDVFRNRDTGIVIVVNRLSPVNAATDMPQDNKALLDIDASQNPNRVLDESEFDETVDALRFAVDKTFFGSVRRPVIEELK